MKPTEGRGYRILLIDDDPSFGRLIKTTAATRNVDITCSESLVDLGTFAQIKNFDGVILDFELPHLDGMEIAEYVDTFFGQIPIVLVSGNDLTERLKAPLPHAIKKFVPKSDGPYVIVDTIIKELDRREFLKQFDLSVS